MITLRIWADICTPKETMLFSIIATELKRRGHEAIFTTRRYHETNDLIKYLGIEAKEIGKHGIDLRDKLEASIIRMNGLFPFALMNKPDVLITLVNPESCRIAYGLGIPVVNFIDMPEADKVCRLTLPLSTQVFAPFVVERHLLKRFWDGSTYYYDCLDPVAWMPKRPKPIGEILDGEITYPFIIYREGETKASYYQSMGMEDITSDVIEAIKGEYPDGTYMGISRYDHHPMTDLQSLLYYADLFVGGGGTINIEAAYWGTWVLSCRPISTAYDRWLEGQGMVQRVRTVGESLGYAREFIESGGKNPRGEILREMEFPLGEICDIIEKTA